MGFSNNIPSTSVVGWAALLGGAVHEAWSWWSQEKPVESVPEQKLGHEWSVVNTPPAQTATDATPLLEWDYSKPLFDSEELGGASPSEAISTWRGDAQPSSIPASSVIPGAGAAYSLYKHAQKILPSGPSFSIPGTGWKFGLFQDDSLKGLTITRVVILALGAYAAYKLSQKLFSSLDPTKMFSMQAVQQQPHINIKIDIHNDHNGAAPRIEVPPPSVNVVFPVEQKEK